MLDMFVSVLSVALAGFWFVKFALSRSMAAAAVEVCACMVSM